MSAWHRAAYMTFTSTAEYHQMSPAVGKQMAKAVIDLVISFRIHSTVMLDAPVCGTSEACDVALATDQCLFRKTG